jgi:hypothetical protein
MRTTARRPVASANIAPASHRGWALSARAALHGRMSAAGRSGHKPENGGLLVLTLTGPKPGRIPALQRGPDLMLSNRYAADPG